MLDKIEELNKTQKEIEKCQKDLENSFQLLEQLEQAKKEAAEALNEWQNWVESSLKTSNQMIFDLRDRVKKLEES